MSKQLDGREGPTFGLNSSRDLYEKLKHDSVRLSEGWHPYAAFDFLVTAWHLHHDWPKSDDSRDTARHKRRESKLPQEMIVVLRTIQDLVNGSKHFQLDPQAAEKRRVQAVHTGNESSWYSYFFHENLPGVTVDIGPIEETQILTIAPFTSFGTPMEIIRAFGGLDKYQHAVQELEQALYG